MRNKENKGANEMEIKTTVVNGWTITTRLAGTNSEYHIAKKGVRVHTSKSMNYLTKLVKAR